MAPPDSPPTVHKSIRRRILPATGRLRHDGLLPEETRCRSRSDGTGTGLGGALSTAFDRIGAYRDQNSRAARSMLLASGAITVASQVDSSHRAAHCWAWTSGWRREKRPFARDPSGTRPRMHVFVQRNPDPDRTSTSRGINADPLAFPYSLIGCNHPIHANDCHFSQSIQPVESM